MFGFPAELFESANVLRARAEGLRQSLRAATILLIDNVAQYYFAHHTGRDGHMDGPEQFPQLAPPFPYAFYEYTLDPAMYDVKFTEAEYGRTRRLDQIGILVQSFDAADVRGGSENVDGFLDERRSGAAAKWVLCAIIFAGHKADREIWGPSAMLILAVGDDGQASSDLRTRIWGIDDRLYGSLPDEQRIPVESISGYAFPALLATSFLHCRNVRTEEHAPPAKLSKAHARRHGQPLVRHKTLTIEPMKQILRKQGQVESQGLTKALHICRGHFKDYRKSGGLFGKHKGLFWWDMHARGALEQEAVVKDYAIKLPESGGSLEHR